jgi:hypothetical protein
MLWVVVLLWEYFRPSVIRQWFHSWLGIEYRNSSKSFIDISRVRLSFFSSDQGVCFFESEVVIPTAVVPRPNSVERSLLRA